MASWGRLVPRVWVAAFLLTLAVFGFGQLEAWPFTSWYMFSHLESDTVHVATAVVVAPDGAERTLTGLPPGLMSHRLLEATERDPAAVCSSLRTVAGASARIQIEQLTWRPLDRDGARPAAVRREVLHRCE